MATQVDLMNKNGRQGDVANSLANNSDVGVMRPFLDKYGRPFIQVFKGGDATKPENYKVTPVNNATLRRDEWKELDEAVLRVAQERLTGIQDLLNSGLTYNLTNAMGTTVFETHKVSDAFTADLTMDGNPQAENDRPKFSTEYMPIPIVHADYQLNSRVVASSRRLGSPLDATNAELAARSVAEKLEEMLFTNTSYTYGGGTIYSYINHPSNNDVTLDDNWDDSAASAADILGDVRAMKQASLDAKHYGPWMLYIPTNFESRMDDDYDATTPGTTIRERILKIEGINAVKVADKLPDDNVLLVQMTSDVVRLVEGMPIQNVEWDSNGKFVTNYKVMTIRVPQIRADSAGNSGVTLLS